MDKVGDTLVIPPARCDRPRDLERDQRGLLLGVSFVSGPRSDRGHRVFATAAEISNLLAASERPRESAQRMRACLMQHIACMRACRVRIRRQMYARVKSRAIDEGGARFRRGW